MVWKFHANWLYSVISLIFTTCCREVPKQTHDDDGLERAICIENKIEFREMSASARAIGIRVCMRHVLAKCASCIVHRACNGCMGANSAQIFNKSHGVETA